MLQEEAQKNQAEEVKEKANRVPQKNKVAAKVVAKVVAKVEAKVDQRKDLSNQQEEENHLHM